MKLAVTLRSLLFVAAVALAGCGGGGGSPAPTPPAPPTPVAPTITQQPAAVAVTEGEGTSFSVTATGTAPITYQWRRNGQAISGATQNTLALPATAFYEGGDRFSVVVSNATGQATSADAVLTVNIKPKLALCSTAYVVRADETLWSWGSNTQLTLGRGSTDTANQITPQQVPGLSNVVNVVCGFGHALALLRDGTVRAWGTNMNGQIGDGTRTNRAAPVPVSGLNQVIALAAGRQGSYALRRDGTLWRWGVLTSAPLLNVSDPNALLTPQQMQTPEPMRAFALRYGEIDSGLTVGRTGQLYYFGQDRGGQFPFTVDPVTAVPGVSNAAAVGVGYLAAAVLRSDGTVWVWGRNYGQFGDGQAGADLFSAQPRQVPGLPRAEVFSFNGGHLIAADNDRRLWSWGENSYGELGRDLSTQSATPTVLTAPLDVETFVAGSVANSMAMTRDGRIWAWGYNFNGNLGVPYPQVIGTATPTLVNGVTGR